MSEREAADSGPNRKRPAVSDTESLEPSAKAVKLVEHENNGIHADTEGAVTNGDHNHENYVNAAKNAHGIISEVSDEPVVQASFTGGGDATVNGTLEDLSDNSQNTEPLNTESLETVQYSLEAEDNVLIDNATDKVENSESTYGSSNRNLINSEVSDEALSAGQEATSSTLEVTSTELRETKPSTSAMKAEPSSSTAEATPSTSGNTGSPEKLVKVPSVYRDSQAIAGVLNVPDDEEIYNKLMQHRSAANRVDVVTNELLESAAPVPATSTAAATQHGGPNEAADDTTQLIEDVDRVIAEVKDRVPDLHVDPNQVFLMLEQHQMRADRRAVVFAELTKNIYVPAVGQTKTIYNDMQTVMKAYPQADINVVYCWLDVEEPVERRVELVMNRLQRKYGPPVVPPVVPSAPQRLVEGAVDAGDDPIYADVLVLAQIFPNKNQDELYAYLQAYHDRPDRLQIVSRELLTGPDDEQSLEETPPVDMSSATESQSLDVPDEPQPSCSGTGTSQLEKDVELLCSFYPQCDPNYIYDRLEVFQNNPDRVQRVSQELESNMNYPKLKDRVETEKRTHQLLRLQNLEANIADLQLSFPDITEHFYKTESKMSNSYKDHLKVQLEFDYPWLTGAFLNEVAKAYNYHLLPTYRQLEGLRKADVERKNRQKSTKTSDKPAYPNVLDEYFFKELLYTKNEEKIIAMIREDQESRKQRFDEAKTAGLLEECTCCFDDEIMPEDMLTCPEGHAFCRQCVMRSTEVAVGESRAKFPCLTGTCESDFTLAVIQKAVTSKTFSLVLRRLQEEELRQAGIENLVNCPFCSFATIMENLADKVFRCLNPECLKESCRLCKEENHIPLHCDEVERQNEVDMRTYIENKMTEAMVRTCHNCNRRFFKIEGCNKMTCVCGASMCYVCRKPIKDYSHFNDGKCNDANAVELHRQEVEAAFKKAEEEYLKEHPEAKDIKLKHDPKEHIDEAAEAPQHLQGRQRRMNTPRDFLFMDGAIQARIGAWTNFWPAQHRAAQLGPEALRLFHQGRREEAFAFGNRNLEALAEPLPLPLPHPQVEDNVTEAAEHEPGDSFDEDEEELNQEEELDEEELDEEEIDGEGEDTDNRDEESNDY